MNNSTYLNEQLTLPYYQSINTTFSVISMVVIVLGTLGNILLVAVVIHNRSIRSSTRFLMGFLGCVDILALWTALFRYWMMSKFAINLRNLSAELCRWHAFFTYLSTDVAVWTLCALNIERFVLVFHPASGRNTARSFRIALIIAASLICMGCLKDGLLLAIEFTTEHGCGSIPFIRTHDYTIIDQVFSSFLPDSLLISTCVGILYRLRRNSRRVGNIGECDVQSTAALNATKLLLVVAFWALITRLPSFVYMIYQSYWYAEIVIAPLAIVQHHDLVYIGVMLLQLSNNGLRFYVFLISSRPFRDIFIAMMRQVLLQIKKQ